MQVYEIAIKDIQEYKNNPRFNDKAVAAVQSSIASFGFKNPIVIDKDNVIIAGHTRVKAAERLGMDTVPCIIADDLSPEQVQAFRLADNKTASIAEWDFNKLEQELEELTDIDMSQFGFDEITATVEDEEQEKPTAEVTFTKSVDEFHNYVVLMFDNEIDWLQACTMFNICHVKELSTRKDGVIHKSQEKYGIGRIIDGATAINKIRGDVD